MDGIKKSRQQLRLREKKRKREEADFLKMQGDEGLVIVLLLKSQHLSAVLASDKEVGFKMGDLVGLLREADLVIPSHF